MTTAASTTKTTATMLAPLPLLLALLLLFAAAVGGARAQSARGCLPAEQASLSLTYDAADTWTEPAVGRKPPTQYRRYCFRVTASPPPGAAASSPRGAPRAAECDPATRCCRPGDAGFKVAAFSLAAAPKCAEARTASRIRAAYWWSVAPAPATRRTPSVTATLRRAASPAAPPAYDVRMRRSFEARADDLACVNIPVVNGGAGGAAAAAQQQCTTIEDLCGGPTCAFTLTTTVPKGDRAACCIAGAASLAAPLNAACPDGAGGDPSDPGCRACPPGTYGKGLKPTEACVPCPSGTAAPAEGSASCEACPLGAVPTADRASCAGGCANGFGGGPSGACERCPPGTYGAGLGVTEPCKPCAGASDYAPAAGSGQCTACPAGSLPNAERTACTRCAPGYGGNAAGTGCALCTPGTFGKDLAAGEPCRPCAGANEYAPFYGHDACRACAAGTTANAARTGCARTCEWW